MVGGLIPAHIRSSTVDVSATGFAPLHTLRHHPSDRITLMSHLQEMPSLSTGALTGGVSSTAVQRSCVCALIIMRDTLSEETVLIEPCDILRVFM